MHCTAPAHSACGDPDLRTALRHIPILPAPKTIDDLVARLDRRASGGSAALAQIVQDARSDNPVAEQGHRNVAGRAQSYSRMAINKAVQLGSRCIGIIVTCMLFGAVLVTTPLPGDRSLLITPTANASNEVINSRTPQDAARFHEEHRPLSIGPMQPAPSRGVRVVSADASMHTVTAPPASPKKLRTLRPSRPTASHVVSADASMHTVTAPPASPKKLRTLRPSRPSASQRAVQAKAKYASFPAGLVCGVARVLLLRCNLRS